MSAGRTIKGAIIILNTLVIGVLLWCFASGAWINSTLDLTILLVAALTTGMALSMPLWLLVNRHETEVRRLAHYIEALSRPDQSDSPLYRPRLGMSPIAQAAESGLSTLRERVRRLASQRRELEVQARLADAERRHAEAILNSITDAVVVTDAFNEVALANESAARTLGFELSSANRQPIDRVVRDPVLVKLIKDTREGGDASLRRHIEHRLNARGREAAYDVTLTCVAGDTPGADHHMGNGNGHNRETVGVVTILRDITREKEIAEMKSDFVSNVSHELRTPLSSIKAYMEMLVDGEAQDEQTRLEFYNIIQGETNRLSRLIDNILNISRIESGVIKVQREHISLPALIKEVVDVMQPQARAKNIELIESPSPLYFQVFADKDMICQATFNLVGNAIKYTPEGGMVRVELSVDEHSRTVHVSVTDSGVGIPEDDLPHLFEKFYRVADHKKLAKGTGLGLNLVKHIVETVHGGKVSVRSKIGNGSTFTFSLPIAENG